MKTEVQKKPHGGPRKGAGRKRVPNPLSVFSVRLTQEHAQTARALGAGDLSAGIRTALEKVG